MAFHDDLLTQARALIRMDRNRPKQANLKRGVSATYYALFHLLIDEACQMLIGSPQKSLRPIVRRAFAHSEMLASAKQFSTGQVPIKLSAALGLPLSHDLVFVAKTFVDLQQARHEADYAVAAGISRAEALSFLETAEEAFEKWQRIRGNDEAKVFLASLLIWNKIRT